ncbi:MAG: ABC transporter ATP-binding protein [Candidatus Sumerlaea chitinivorans]|nr:ABC transporter ATP-binding protein [Candidatus Sumerlaea chitinivorans]
MKSTKPIISFEGVWKAYRLHPPASLSLPQRIGYTLRHLWKPELLEVLRDLTFQIGAGESVALLGMNGCGKTTLLKLICGITRPTRGKITVDGRAGGLIELTSGFHEDLTGWENIYLNATLLGLPRAEINRRLRDIVEFAELGDFIHSPVRHYSWGMLLRLGFAIAVHADLDVLVVDEALAVGDGYFQWKCLKKIEELKAGGTTLLFVSHVPAQAEAVCERAIWLEGGGIREDGPASVVARHYSESIVKRLCADAPSNVSLEVIALVPNVRLGSGEIIIQSVKLLNWRGERVHVFKHGEPWKLEIEADARVEMDNIAVVVQIDLPNRTVAKFYSHQEGPPLRLTRGRWCIRMTFPAMHLYEGTYYLTVGMVAAEQHLRVYDGLVHMFTFSVKSMRTERFSARALDLGAHVEVCQVSLLDKPSTAITGDHHVE